MAARTATTTANSKPKHARAAAEPPRREKTMTNFEKILTNELAQRIYDIDPYEAQDADETPETIAESITQDPLTVIKFLVDMIEDLQA